MNDGFDLDVINSLKLSITTKNAKKYKLVQDKLDYKQKLEEKRELAYEQHMTYFFEQLVDFVKNEIPKRLDNGGTSIINNKLYICSTRIPFNKLNNDIELEQTDFIKNLEAKIRNDSRFITKYNQLLSEIGILLIFDILEYYDEDDDMKQYPDDIKNNLKMGHFFLVQFYKLNNI